MTEVIEQIRVQAVVLAPKIYAGLFVLVGFWVFALIVERLVFTINVKANLQKNIIILIGRITKIALIILGVVCALGTMGVNVSALVASLGLTGFALGFALKDALSNILAGVLVLVYRPFKIGDEIRVAGFEGRVLEIDLRYTTLLGENNKVLIPNSNLFNFPVVIVKEIEG